MNGSERRFIELSGYVEKIPGSARNPWDRRQFVRRLETTSPKRKPIAAVLLTRNYPAGEVIAVQNQLFRETFGHEPRSEDPLFSISTLQPDFLKGFPAGYVRVWSGSGPVRRPAEEPSATGSRRSNMSNSMTPSAKQLSLPQLVDTRKASEIFGRSAATLKRWRCEGVGPSWIAIEGRVSYDVAVLLEYIRKNTRMPSVRAMQEDTREAV